MKISGQSEYRKPERIKVIVGLGNPGRRYRQTRHNLGFRVLDVMAEETSSRWKKKSRLSAWIAHVFREGNSLILVKPGTYVNHSGRAVQAILSYYNLSSRETLVVIDDVNLEPGTIRIRQAGGAGGHHGLESIIQTIGSRDFVRIRIGIGGSNLADLTGHVLSRPSKDEEEFFKNAVSNAAAAIDVIAREGIEQAMNEFNQIMRRKDIE